jgi:cytochrome P450
MRTHGDHVRFRVGPPRLGFVFDAVFSPEGARQVLGAGGDTYVRDAPVIAEFTHLFGRGLATTTGERWVRHRRILQPLFTRRYVERSIGAVATAADELVAEWRGPGDAGREVDLREGSMRFSLRALGRVIFGDGELDDAWPVLQTELPVLATHAARRGLAPVRIPRSWPTAANRRAERGRRRLRALVDELVRDRGDRPEGDDLLGRLLAATDPETGARMGDDEVRDEVLIFLLAGHETTGCALALTLYLLGRHPGVQQRVREEVDRTVGRGAPTWAEVEQLQFTRQVVLEALRLYPPVHTLVRTAVDGGELLGHELPPGRVVAVSVWGIHRNPAVWCDPDRFDPTRFDEDVDHDRHAHLPFGAGPRACIGGHLAMAELVVAVAAVVRAFHVHADDADPALEASVTLRPGGPLLTRLEPVGPVT